MHLPPLLGMSCPNATHSATHKAPRKATRAAARGGEGEGEALKTEWDFLYWTAGPVNGQGDTLAECLDKYGVGGWSSEPSEKNMTVCLVYLSAERADAHSWLLGAKRTDNGEQGEAGAYARDPSVRRLRPGDAMYTKVIRMLHDASFGAI
eukprot:7384786-Prymnesium_polylepis.7